MFKINQEARTALGTAWVRARHLEYDAPPWVFEDPLARKMLADDEYDFCSKNFAEQYLALDSDGERRGRGDDELLAGYMRTAAAPAEMLTRQRYGEQVLDEETRKGVVQYVMLGAGMDTYALRNPDTSLRVYEVDRPGAQEFKRQRIAQAGLDTPPCLRFVPVDFKTKGFAEGLLETDFDPSCLTYFSWLGVTHYLDWDAISHTLAAISNLGCPGSQVVFDYISRDAFDPDGGSMPLKSLAAKLASIGEPIYQNFQPEKLAIELNDLGLSVVENLSPSEIFARYLSKRTDGYRATEFVYFARAEIPVA